jgi:hypothetical protein
MTVSLENIIDLIRRESKSYLFTCNAEVNVKGKGMIVPIPFPFDAYIVEQPGDYLTRVPEGDFYQSEIKIFTLKDISVMGPIGIPEKLITFGFLNTNFTVTTTNTLIPRMYRILSRRSVADQYFVYRGGLSG